MTALAGLVDVLESFDGVKGHYFFVHELVGSDEAVAMWHLVDENWHLFSSDSFFVQTSIAHLTKEIRHSNGDDDWNKDINILGSLHHDYHQ